jgi:Spy/CpxP family protein refolding chaperone
MKRLLLFCLLTILALSGSYAQNQDFTTEKRQKIKAAKIGLITNTLNLTPEQATQFWPVYNEYDDKRAEVRKQIRQLAIESNTLTATDDKLMTNLKTMQDLRQKETDLEKEYANKFLKVLTVRQVVELEKTEHRFTQMLLHRLNKEGKEKDPAMREQRQQWKDQQRMEKN